MVVGPPPTTLHINVSGPCDDDNNDDTGSWNQEYRNKSRPVRPKSWVVLVLLISLCLYLFPHPVLGVRRSHLSRIQNQRIKNRFSRPTGKPSTVNTRTDGPNEIDLLRMVEEQSVNNTITKISSAGFLLREGFNGQISEQKLKNFLKKPSRTFSLHLHGSFSASGKFRATLLSVYGAKHQQHLPLLEIWVDTWNMSLVVRYQGERSFQRVSIQDLIPMDPLSRAVSQQYLDIGWHQILLTFGPSRLRVNVDCLPERVVTLRQKLVPLDKHARFFFGHDQQRSNYMQGLFYKAKLYSHVVQEMQWICPNENALQADDAGVEVMTTKERFTMLQRQVDQLMVLVDTLQQQNTKLSERVDYLETCDCEPRCKYEGKIFKDQETWQTDMCTICRCQEGKPFCSVRADIPGCSAPCQSSPCKHGGTCISDGEKGTFTCECPHPFSGVHCEVWMNPYVWQLDPGYCHDVQLRYYFDRDTDRCLQFNYTGCGGNVNNFISLSECQKNTMSGACCTRQYSVDINDIITGSQTVHTKCQILSATACSRLHRKSEDHSEEFEVVGFYPGLSCEAAQCPVTHPGGDNVNFCHIPGRSNVRVGQKAVIGCEECTCISGGKWKCRCAKINVRKEIRDMTWDETVRFQQAVSQIHLSGVDNVWDRFRDLYMAHSMHSHGGPFYLPWHRMFLRQLEQQLKEVDCGITLPYFDFTTDAANFSRAIIWQPNYFGGDGGGWCVPDHPFGDRNAWRPCLRRNFNYSIPLPTMLDVTVAISNNDFLEMSNILEAFAGYIHSFIGGEMLTTTSAYDPLFYAIHSYIDQLYATWQKMSNNKHKFPAVYGNIAMVPFNVAPKDVLDLEGDLCVTYAPPTKGRPCNSSESTFGSAVSGVAQPDILVKVISNSGYDQFGYDQDGFDRRGFDKSGFDRLGFNRDGLDREGYDKNGYNRYGFDQNGYNKHGFNKLGFDNNGNRDMTSIYSRMGYDRHCLNRKGLTRDDYDRYGYNTDGYDSDYCGYSFNGPFVTEQSLHVWEILHTQPHDFLITLTKTCEPLQRLPNSWYEKFWTQPPKTAVTDLVKSDIPLEKEEDVVSRNMCFLVKPYISPCPCPKVTTCTHNLCLDAECPSYPEATCHIDVCAECTPVWYLKGEIVDCKAVRDYCEPNPCQHGGTCVQSEWPNQKWMVSCHCPPGYEGKNCQYKSTDVCSLPLQTGNCRLNISRWYFDFKLSKCVEFHYTGCWGNGNLFETRKDCQDKCLIGACCYRKELSPQYIYGYGPDRFDRYGFDVKGFNKQYKQYNTKTGLERGVNRFKKDGYDWQGYDRDGYNSVGYDRLGYDRNGYDPFGFNISGYSKVGEFDGIIDYNEAGYDEEGYNRAGYNCEGVNREGLDYYGRHAGFKYNCLETTLFRCQRLEIEEDVKVIRFSPGKTCKDSSCKSECGCWFNNKVYKINQKFSVGCEEFRCQLGGVPKRGICKKLVQRKEIRDLTPEELKRYHIVIRKLQEETVQGKPSVWFEFAQMYSEHLPQALGSPMFLPWHRYFLFMVEKAMLDIECEVTIPYYDWTVDSGSMDKSIVWSNSFFGGNGDEVTECVRYHPFKEFHPPFWSPCLRRQFNTSVNLPDAVHTYLAIQETIFADFSSYMEAMSHLFRMRVGGHMNSPLSPYDPVFISHIAFIDKLWNEWQRRHKKGLLKFPHEFRFIPMEPFRVSPDDVLDSKKQMCINYVEVTLGSPCNRTEKQTFGSDRFDLHGFDKEGYDHDGFNVQGLNRQGYIDQRGIYNKYGFDREGFSRSGYEPTGFDRHQFYIDSYNLDGYNPNGFDRTGRNRYGLNKIGKTPYGLHRGQGKSKEKDYFGLNGYNQLGVDKNGFDRKGFDMFGFTKEGYNHFGCNYYFNGPFYLIIFQSIKHKLEQLETIDSLINIPRLCPHVTQLPNWMYKTYWLNRKQNIPEVLAIMALNRQPNPQPFEEEFGKLWVPPNSDDRFCLESNFFSKCPLGEPPVHCSHDFCLGTTCPGFPDAVCRVKGCGQCKVEWYSRHTGEVLQCEGCMDDYNRNRLEGSSWHNENCDNCTCVKGVVQCLPLVCPTVDCEYPAIVPGQCCPNCDDGCEYNGKHYRPNSEFRSKSNACKLCYCRYGNVHCEKRACPVMDTCHNLVTLEGDCCPTCLDCGEHQNGTEWEEDDCRVCTCVNGQVTCKKNQCLPLPCDHPHQPKGKCCPVCQDCELDNSVHKHGSVYEKDECTLCKCQYGTVICQTKKCQPLSCKRSIKLPGMCCPVCDAGCKYSGMKYEHGSVFSPAQDPCKNCTCFKSEVTCAPVICPQNLNTNCHHPVQTFGDCCPATCPTCSLDGMILNIGEMGRSKKNPCKECLCNEGGKLECSTRTSCPFECSHGVIEEGECCSQCKDCLVDGRVILDESLFTRGINGCQECYCNDGSIICQPPRKCPFLECKEVVTPEGSCCPHCKGCKAEGIKYDHADEIPSNDSCTECTCIEGLVLCRKKQCPHPTCQNPRIIPGDCCPSCHPYCEYKGIKFRHGQMVKDPLQPCLQCTCNIQEVTNYVAPKASDINCEDISDQCSPIPCAYPDKARGECCPVCKNCFYLRRHFRHKQKFMQPGGDPCRVCTCENGEVLCSRMNCSVPKCDNPQQLPKQCCPTCPSSCELRDGTSYIEGEKFMDPHDPCQECVCQGSEITCENKECPPLSCTHPARKPGQCCPTCTFCLYDSRIFRNGQTFLNPKDSSEKCKCTNGSMVCNSIDNSCILDGKKYQDGAVFANSQKPCKDCVCQRGRVGCRPKPCPTLICQYPAKTSPSDCCSVCENCAYYGQVFRNLQTFPDPSARCSICLCKNGDVTCSREPCPILPCAHPSLEAGQCCPTCQNCEYASRFFQNEESFTNPENPCQNCQCRNGEVKCKTFSCPPVSCTHPAIQENCCPTCTSCLFERRIFAHGNKFADPTNKCQVCQCLGGNVVCEPQECPPITCNKPVMGECCPECGDCIFNGRVIQNQQKFIDESDDCLNCQCHDGNIKCLPEDCPNVLCTHPVHKRCCKECANCEYRGIEYNNSQSFLDPQNHCQQCTCQNGNIRCQQRQCPLITCQNPVQSDCCLTCEDCLYGNQLLRNGESVPDSTNKCHTCTCHNGDVRCVQKQCPAVTCTHPVQGTCCPECDDCLWDKSWRVTNGGQVNDDSQCKVCECEDGTMVCYPKHCPPVSCSHPAVDKCCPRCENCLVDGEFVLNEKQRITDYYRPCRECTCKNGSYECEQDLCPLLPTSCSDASIEGCSNCTYNGRQVANSENFTDPVDSCRQCTCKNGNMVCRRKACPPPLCKNPVSVKGKCCPVCTVCNYQGQSYNEGETFTDPENSCNECVCHFGHVNCSVPSLCNPASCTHPYVENCCPTCNHCTFEGEFLQAGQTIKPDACRTCTCIEGNVTCVKQSCPPLDCLLKVDVPGECCPRCKDCDYKKRHYRSGATWFLDENPCVSCTCHGGLVTCTEFRCIVPCANYIELPGQCCPVCPTCTYKGITYKDGDTFSPNEDPCDQCTCEAGKLRCFHQTCPETATCPQSQLVDPRPGTCCPTCSGFGSNCTQEMIGEIIHPRPEDPCFYCECKESYNWICIKDICPEPLCPESVQKRVAGTCCPVCPGPACYYDVAFKYYKDGAIWKDPNNPCIVCQCLAGTIQCNFNECQPLRCRADEHLMKLEGECCEKCVSALASSCLYHGQEWKIGQTWSPDECTTCECAAGGKSVCEIQKCPPVDCGSNQSPAVLPRSCCPVCQAIGSNCTQEMIGEIIHPRPEDPCFYCECKESYNWICIKDICPEPLCPESVQKRVAGTCCPVCPAPACYYDVAFKYYKDGAIWKDPNNHCIVCQCLAGTIQCNFNECQPLRCRADEHLMKLEGECCEKCVSALASSCLYHGQEWKIGQTWSPDECTTCECAAGGKSVCEIQKCPPVDCGSNQSPAVLPRSCCPVCQAIGSNCTQEMIGEIIHPRPEDPCFYCECKESYNWICIKNICPEPFCPESVQKRVAGTCCPVCPIACYYDVAFKYYKDGAIWKDPNNPCIVCQCLAGTIQCNFNECQPLRCRADEHLMKLEGECCEKCVSALASSCLYHGQEWKIGQTWSPDECTTCECAAGGKSVCEVQKCPPVDCGSNQSPAVLPRSCCPVCQAKPASCIVYGDPHYQTFDGATVHFQGVCKYIMAADCENEDFVVEVQHDSRGVFGVSWAQNLTVRVAGLEIGFQQNSILTVDGEHKELPFFYSPHVYIEKTGTNIILNSKPGMKLVWNGESYAELIVPGNYKEKMCGLCGNFNGFPHDDMKTREGQITNSPAIFGNSWKARKQLQGTCEDAIDVDPCSKASYPKRKRAASKCDLIKSQVFSRCHRLVSPEPFYSSCVYDMCACPEDFNCLCDILQTYARECAKAKVRVQWRSSTLCAINCDEEKGFMFDDCGPPCIRTCDNIQSRLTNSTAGCYKPCVPSCQCPAHQVVHNGRCIDISKCP